MRDISAGKPEGTAKSPKQVALAGPKRRSLDLVLVDENENFEEFQEESQNDNDDTKNNKTNERNLLLFKDSWMDDDQHEKDFGELYSKEKR